MRNCENGMKAFRVISRSRDAIIHFFWNITGSSRNVTNDTRL